MCCDARRSTSKIGGDPFAFHQDSLGLPDESARAERFGQVPGLGPVGGSFFGGVDGESRESREELSFGSVGGAEGLW